MLMILPSVCIGLWTGAAFSVTNRYTSQQLNEDTGLYFYKSRYYDPELARFTQADTIVPSANTSQALNRYSYAFNNPLKFTDPSGNVPKDLDDSTSEDLTEVSNSEVGKNPTTQNSNSSFDASGNVVQGSKSSFHGQGTTDINGGSGAGTLNGSPADNNSPILVVQQSKSGRILGVHTKLETYCNVMCFRRIGNMLRFIRNVLVAFSSACWLIPLQGFVHELFAWLYDSCQTNYQPSIDYGFSLELSLFFFQIASVWVGIVIFFWAFVAVDKLWPMKRKKKNNPE